MERFPLRLLAAAGAFLTGGMTGWIAFGDLVLASVFALMFGAGALATLMALKTGR